VGPSTEITCAILYRRLNMLRRTYYSALDLGQSQDPCALAVLERIPMPDSGNKGSELSRYAILYLQRWPLLTPYPEINEDVAKLFAQPQLRGSMLTINQTQVGRAITSRFRRSSLKGTAKLGAVTVINGHTATPADDESMHVPKRDLVSVLRMLFQWRRLDIALSLPDAGTLIKELEHFRMKPTPAATDTYEAFREGANDDLVFAVAIAAWYAERFPPLGIPKVPWPLRDFSSTRNWRSRL
jgi:hypothetical protein